VGQQIDLWVTDLSNNWPNSRALTSGFYPNELASGLHPDPKELPSGLHPDRKELPSGLRLFGFWSAGHRGSARTWTELDQLVGDRSTMAKIDGKCHDGAQVLYEQPLKNVLTSRPYTWNCLLVHDALPIQSLISSTLLKAICTLA